MALERRKALLTAGVATAAAAFLLALPGSAAAATSCAKVASPGGSDSAAGTLRAPVRSVQRLVDLLAPGQTGCLRGGSYTGDDEIRIDTPRVSLTSYAEERATVTGRLWVSSNGDGVQVTDLNLVGASSSTLPSPTITADDVVFARNDVTTNHTAICFIVGEPTYGHARRTLIEGNRIHNCGVMPAANHDHGIYVEEATDTVIRGNWIYDNADRGIQFYPNADRTKVVGNVIDGNGQGIIFGGNAHNSADGNVVERNVISNSNIRFNVESYYDPGNAIGTGNRVRQNCIYGATGWYAGPDNSGIQDPQQGFVAADNMIEAPQFVDRAGKNFELAPGSKCARLVSGSLTVGIKLEAGRRNVRVDQPLPLRGTTSGAEHGARVTIAVKGRRGWATLGRATVQADGTFRSRVRVGSRGTKMARLRAAVPGLGTSSPVRVRVKRS